MNLPIFHPLLSDQSTYITFSKSLLDFDYAITNEKEYYFSKMVALNLPQYENPDFFIDLSSVDIVSTNPNVTIPAGMQYYMENIIRQNVGNGSKQITELAFYKFLNYCGISYNDIHDSIVFVNKIATSNFIKTENNNGWGELVCLIPNNSKQLNKLFKNVDIPDIIVSNDTDAALYDNGNKQFLFDSQITKQVIDFDNITYNDSVSNSFDFNIILLFYKDSDGVDKLHGINFINPFENKVTHYELPKYTQKTNDSRSIGYQFNLNMKTVNNEASTIIIEDYNDGFWATHFETLTKLNSFLELQMQKDSIINPL